MDSPSPVVTLIKNSDGTLRRAIHISSKEKRTAHPVETPSPLPQDDQHATGPWRNLRPEKHAAATTLPYQKNMNIEAERKMEEIEEDFSLTMGKGLPWRTHKRLGSTRRHYVNSVYFPGSSLGLIMLDKHEIHKRSRN
ncbi:hypothetical protein NL676_011929 [Syzygium grande]|nr:hypothetical protein NL676_011929 [Syzygium grande]